jgi:hypothetical protein
MAGVPGDRIAVTLKGDQKRGIVEILTAGKQSFWFAGGLGFFGASLGLPDTDFGPCCVVVPIQHSAAVNAHTHLERSECLKLLA